MRIRLTRSLEFVRSSLFREELEKMVFWYKSLHYQDKKNAQEFLRNSYDLMCNQPGYFIVGATGNTMRKEAYEHVGLVVVTNNAWEDMTEFGHTGVIEECQDGILLTLNTKKGKPIHVAVKQNMEDESEWREQAKKPIVIYRCGNYARQPL